MTEKRAHSVEVPNEDQGAMASLLRLSDPALRGLEDALRKAQPTLDREQLLSQLRDEPGLATVDDLEQLVGTLLSLAGTAYSGGTSLHEIVDVVVSGIQDDN